MPGSPCRGMQKCINVSKIFVFFLSRRGQNVSSLHYVPDGTLVSDGILLSTDMLSLRDGKQHFLERIFQKNEYYIFTSHLGDR